MVVRLGVQERTEKQKKSFLDENMSRRDSHGEAKVVPSIEKNVPTFEKKSIRTGGRNLFRVLKKTSRLCKTKCSYGGEIRLEV